MILFYNLGNYELQYIKKIDLDSFLYTPLITKQGYIISINLEKLVILEKIIIENSKFETILILQHFNLNLSNLKGFIDDIENNSLIYAYDTNYRILKINLETGTIF